MSLVIAKFDCKLCNKAQDLYTDVFTTWILHDGFICRNCFDKSTEKDNYEVVELSQYVSFMRDRPQCYHCAVKIYTDAWSFCQTCELDFCKKCNLILCSSCRGIMVDEYAYNY
jgi:hypothetical protein